MSDLHVQYQPLSKTIVAGKVSGNLFTTKEGITEEAITAVAQRVLANYPEGMTWTTETGGDGSEITVKEL